MMFFMDETSDKSEKKNPFIYPLYSALVSKWLRQSITNMRRKGDSESPCQRPREAWIFPLSLPMENEEFFYKQKIHKKYIKLMI